MAPAPGAAKKFFRDDPLLQEPRPLAVGKLKPEKLSDAGEFLLHSFHQPGQRQTADHPIHALDVNTLDEVPDGVWYTNRHYANPMSIEALVRGPDGGKPPAMDKPWTILQAKLEGGMPGIRILDSAGRSYRIRFDPPGYIEMSTAADVIGSKMFYALGYNVPDNYPVRFARAQLRLGENVRFRRDGEMRMMDLDDLNRLLSKAARYPDGSFRGVASRNIEGDLLGPFEYYGTRPDDPNDTVPHEHRRELRGLSVFSAWLGYTDARALNTVDAVQDVDGVQAVRHFLTDFGAILGSAGVRPKEPWQGHIYAIDLKWWTPIQMFTLGLHPADWETATYDVEPSTGEYDAATFEPEKWKPAYPNLAFENRQPADNFWAAKQVMAFTDEQIRALVATGGYTEPLAVQHMSREIAARRDKIVRHYLAQTLAVDRFEVAGGELRFRNFGGIGQYQVAWSRFDNQTERTAPIAGAVTFHVPEISGYLAGRVSDGKHSVTVYVREGRVIGIDR